LGSLSNTLTAKVNLDGYATAPLTMVPELASSAQMLLGLAGLGAVVGLRRRQAQR
jgi:MYXO-CTERM domain-containing protein